MEDKRPRPVKVALIAEKWPYPPLALGYIKAYVEEELGPRVSVDIIYVRKYGEVCRRNVMAKVCRYDLVGFSCYGDLVRFSSLARSIKARSFGRTRVVVGGPMVPRPPFSGVSAGGYIDYLVMGEGEETFARLVHRISEGLGPEGVEGMAYLVDGKYVANPPRRALDPGRIPSPYLKGIFDVENFSEFYVDDARGCPFFCNYCAQSMHLEKGRRVFSLSRVFSEVRYIFGKKKDPHALIFTSPDSFFDRRRAMRMLNFLSFTRGKRRTVFNLMGNAFFLDDGLVDKFRGGYEIGFGIQSLSRAALKFSNRTLDIDKVTSNIRKYGPRILERGNSFSLSFIYGLPGDNLKSFSGAMDFALSAAPDLHFYRLSVFPYTYFGAHKCDFNIEARPDFPFLVTRSSGYTRSDIGRTARLVSRIAPALEMSLRHPLLRRFLLLLAGHLGGGGEYLRVYSDFSAWLTRGRKKGFGWKSRLMPDGLIDFAKRRPGLSRDALRNLERAAENSAARLAWRERGEHLRSAAETALGGLRKNGGRVLSIVWSDFQCADRPGDCTLFLNDGCADNRVRSQDNAEPLWSAARALDSLPREDFDAALLPFVWSFAGRGVDAAKLLRAVCRRVVPGGGLLFFDNLGSEEISFILDNCGRRANHSVIFRGRAGVDLTMHIITLA